MLTLIATRLLGTHLAREIWFAHVTGGMVVTLVIA
jgi:hypothetical protein